MKIALCWLCYGCGHVAFLLNLDRWEWGYKVYSWFMVTAHELQGDDTRGPWGPIESDDPTNTGSVT